MAAHDPPGIDTFMGALGAVESRGRYEAVNTTSGAYGKYQIMPSNWPSWALRYLGDANAPWTPANQDTVARGKLSALFRWLGSWEAVAHWWLTGDGSTDVATWSSSSIGYVNRVMSVYGAGGVAVRAATRPAPAAKPAPAKPAANTLVVDESARGLTFSGGWSLAEHARYNDGQVRYAIAEGATMWFTFTGSAIAWVGPAGPTRGEAAVYLDEEYVGNVDVFRRSFRARNVLFEKTFDRVGTHTILIEVLGTPGREAVAVDEFIVTQ